MKNEEANKIKALLRLYYLDLFCNLENQIKDIFRQEVTKIDGHIKYKLFFFYGSHKSKEYPDFSIDKLIRKEKTFKIDETFSEFSLIEIMRILDKEPFIDRFNFDIQSIARKAITYPFCESVIKLIQMRNILAHQPVNTTFKDEYIIENLSVDTLSKNNPFDLHDHDISKMDLDDKYILSNLIYMDSIFFQLILSEK